MKMDRRLAVALGITALFGVATVRAAELGRVNVPFAFEALGQRLEAGTYRAGDNSGALVVRNDKTGQGIFVLPVPIGLTNGGQSSMTFRCYGPECFLNGFSSAAPVRCMESGRRSARKNWLRSSAPRSRLLQCGSERNSGPVTAS